MGLPCFLIGMLIVRCWIGEASCVLDGGITTEYGIKKTT